MATAAEINTDISCIICLNVFTDPRSLPCGHTFCHNCLNEHIKRTVRGSTFRCPFCRAPATVKHSIQQQESFARQFPVNYPLVQTIDLIQKLQIQNTNDQLRTKLKTVHEKLHMTCQMVEVKLDQQLDHQLQNLDLSVAQIADNIDNIADKIIKQVTSTVQDDQEALHKQLAICHEKARTNTKAKFNQTKTLLATPKHYLASSTHLLNDEAVSKLEIENNMKAIEVEQTTLKDYFDTHEVEGSSNKIVFTKADNTTKIAPKVGTLNLTDEPTTTGLPPRRTQQIDRQNGRLKLVKVINTSRRSQTWQPILSSIAVLHVQQLTLILVADNNNHHVKSYNDNGTLHSIYSTYGIPSGLAKFRDNQIVVTLPPQKEILFLEVDETKTFLIKRVKTEKSYHMVTALPNFKLAATLHECDQFLDIMDQNCTVLWSAPYSAFNPYNESSLYPKCITVSDNCFLIISDTSFNLTYITKTGDIKWNVFDVGQSFKHEGITCDNLGFIYISHYYGNSIVQLSPIGKFLREIITEDMTNPKAVCFDHDRLYVTQEDAEIRVFKWE